MKRPIVEIDEELCDGCGLCIPACEEGAIKIINGKARLIGDKYCDGLGHCLGNCPSGAIKVIEREAEPFDAQAVQNSPRSGQDGPGAAGCPGVFALSVLEKSPGTQGEKSALKHWPVQINLIRPEMDFLAGADLLITADCAPAASSLYHSELLPGKVALLGCPKFDDQAAYRDKFRAVFSRGDIKSVTVLSMEVPCCKGLLRIVLEGMEDAGADLPVINVILDLSGRIKEEIAVR
ncbi:MAG: ATP-binding protein [Desulfonatronovibrionaceae bacterium]